MSSGGDAGGATGYVYFEQCVGGPTLCLSIQFAFNAEFYPSPTSSCSPTVTSGACAFYSGCTSTSPAAVSAGTLTISGGNLGSGIAVMPDSTNAYNYTAASAMFSAGQTLTVSASGGTVPAFGPESVVAPPAPVLTAPASNGGSYTIPTSSDLTVTWTGGQAGAQVLVEGTNTGTPQDYFSCIWDGAAGQGTVPRAVLAGLAGTSNGYIIWGQIRDALLRGWLVLHQRGRAALQRGHRELPVSQPATIADVIDGQ